jgi:Ca2+-binding EF-hand superfamily protein
MQTMYAKMRAARAEAKRSARAQAAAQDFLLNGLTKAQLEEALGDMFRAADTDGSGELDRKEFAACLKSSDLGLTKKQIALLMDEVDANFDNRIQFSEFIPVAFGLLSEMVSKQMEYDQLPADEAAAMDYLTSLFSEYDVEGTGKLHITALKQAFRDSDIGLSQLQLRAIIAEAKLDAHGELDYREFAKKTAGMIAAILSVMTDSERASRVVAARAGASSFTIMGLTREAFPGAMMQAFSSIDPSGSGRATLDEVGAVLREQLGLDERTVNVVQNVAWEGGLDAEGRCDLNFVAQVSFDVLAQMESLAAY